MTHPFDQAIALEPLSESLWRGATTPEYMNMVGPFGGVTAAVLMNAVLSDPRAAGDPVALSVNFCTGAKPGPFQIETRLERAGKYVQHWSLRQMQGDTVCSTATIVTGQRHETFAHQVSAMPQVPAADQIKRIPPPDALRFLHQYDFRFVEGAPELTAERDTPGSDLSRIWMRDAQPRALDWTSLAALSDGFPLRLLTVRGGLVPMGTVSMTTYFLCTGKELAELGEAPILGEARSNGFNAHFHDQKSLHWSADGRLLMSGTQVVWFRQ